MRSAGLITPRFSLSTGRLARAMTRKKGEQMKYRVTIIPYSGYQNIPNAPDLGGRARDYDATSALAAATQALDYAASLGVPDATFRVRSPMSEPDVTFESHGSAGLGYTLALVDA